VNSARFDNEGKLLVSASGDRTVRVWDAETASEIQSFTVDSEAYDAFFTPNGDHIIALFDDGGIGQFDVPLVKYRGDALKRRACDEKIYRIEQANGSATAWVNRIDSLMSWLRQLNPCAD
jgi:hypothetical protein